MGISHRDKHREDIYQQLCSQIMSGAVDDVSLRAVAAQALSHPDVSSDPVLGSMVRSFIAEREAALRASITPAEQQRLKEERSKVQQAFEPTARSDFPTREALLQNFGRLERDFDGYLAQFEEARAELVLDKMRELRHRFPVHIPASNLQRCEEQLDRLMKRAGQYRRQIEELAKQAAAAAESGDEKTAEWVRRRLEAINMLLPNLLSSQEREKLDAEISRSSQAHDTQETTRELTERQRGVAAKIKDLAGVIHRFHEIAKRLPPSDNAYRRAELNYRRAVEEIRGLNTDWLTGLVLQLETLLEDLDDPSGTMQSQLDRFIGNVRTALNGLCLEIRAWQAKGPPAPPPQPPSTEQPGSPAP